MVVTELRFWILVGLLGMERIAEMIWARINETKLRQTGYAESGEKHYAAIIALHLVYFAALVTEYHLRARQCVITVSPVALSVFLIAQCLRCWAMITLGRRFTARILTKQGEILTHTGLYRIVRHPIYLIVELELVSCALSVGASVTAIAFGIANLLLLWLVRIPAEDRALATALKQVPMSDVIL